MIGASTTCTDSIGANGETIRSCTSNGNGYDGATYTLKFTIETVQYNKYPEAWNVDVAIAEEKPHPATQFLAESATNPRTITSYNDTNADKGKMFYFTHTLNAGTENEKIITETRYIGNGPKNYVYFNCADPVEGQEYNYATSCEVWRIIGVFDVEKEIADPENSGQKITATEQRMKLVRGNILKTDYWDTNNKNDWTTSTLKSYLNTDYYNGLQSSAKGMIDEAKYYLGSVDTSNISVEGLYIAERGTRLCGACNSDTAKLTWQGQVGLMYPSDEYMVYGKGINSTCYNNPSRQSCGNTNAKIGWVYNSNISTFNRIDHIWFLSPRDYDSNNVLQADNIGYLSIYGVHFGSYGVRPVVYLSSDVQIFDGDGSEQNPYKLKK